MMSKAVDRRIKTRNHVFLVGCTRCTRNMLRRGQPLIGGFNDGREKVSQGGAVTPLVFVFYPRPFHALI